MGKPWKKGSGKLGILQPLLGSWLAQADQKLSKASCCLA
jgi:hypothetical protein